MKRFAIYIPPSAFYAGHGMRVAVVEEGDDGYYLTGDWPYEGKVGQKMPWFWGDPNNAPRALKEAQELADEMNLRMGVSAEQAAIIIGESIARGARRGRGRNR